MVDAATGRACSGLGKRPGMYTRVAGFMDWIVNVFRQNNVNPNV